MKTAGDILHEVVNLTMGEKHEEALQLIKDWGCEIVDETKSAVYISLSIVDPHVKEQHVNIDVENLKQRIQENTG